MALAHGRLIHLAISSQPSREIERAGSHRRPVGLQEACRGMKRLAVGFRSGSRSGAILSFLALWTIWASDAQAGCLNHNVTSRDDLAQKWTHLELLDLAGALPAGSAGNPQKAPAPSPCNGAMCSGNPASASAPISTGLAADDGEWALGADSGTLAYPGALDWPRTNANLRSIDRTRSIFHPPRIQAGSTSF